VNAMTNKMANKTSKSAKVAKKGAAKQAAKNAAKPRKTRLNVAKADAHRLGRQHRLFALSGRVYSGKRCFYCGQLLRGSRTREHVFPLCGFRSASVWPTSI
jgi:hypothetical protein